MVVVVVRVVDEHVEPQVLVPVVCAPHVDRHAFVGEPAAGPLLEQLGEMRVVAGVRLLQ
jgi:hypothetical protein